MIVYNVTVKVEKTIADEWLQWLLDEHIPDVMLTGCFIDHKVLRLMDIDDAEGPTFAIQYGAASKSDYNRYMELHAAGMRQRSFDKWGERFIAFRMLMEEVQR